MTGAHFGQSAGAAAPGTMAPALGGPVNLFGLKVKATKLGVIVDVSESTHTHLATVLNAVQQKFKDADIVLTVGCGMFALQKKSEVIVEPLSKLMKLEKDGTRIHVFQQLEKSKVKAINGLAKKLASHPNVYGVNGGGNGAAQDAFAKLIELKDDSIYWFADFADGVNDKVAVTVAEEVAANHIKVYLHSFAGNEPKAILVKMTQDSGGGITVEIPK